MAPASSFSQGLQTWAGCPQWHSVAWCPLGCFKAPLIPDCQAESGSLQKVAPKVAPKVSVCTVPLRRPAKSCRPTRVCAMRHVESVCLWGCFGGPRDKGYHALVCRLRFIWSQGHYHCGSLCPSVTKSLAAAWHCHAGQTLLEFACQTVWCGGCTASTPTVGGTSCRS